MRRLTRTGEIERRPLNRQVASADVSDMAVNRVTGVSGAHAATAPQPVGITAQLADARAQLRSVTPAGSWEGVLAEVKHLQATRGISLLAALEMVYGKLLAGWVPPPR